MCKKKLSLGKIFKSILQELVHGNSLRQVVIAPAEGPGPRTSAAARSSPAGRGNSPKAASSTSEENPRETDHMSDSFILLEGHGCMMNPYSRVFGGCYAFK